MAEASCLAGRRPALAAFTQPSPCSVQSTRVWCKAQPAEKKRPSGAVRVQRARMPLAAIPPHLCGGNPAAGSRQGEQQASTKVAHPAMNTADSWLVWTLEHTSSTNEGAPRAGWHADGLRRQAGRHRLFVHATRSALPFRHSPCTKFPLFTPEHAA